MGRRPPVDAMTADRIVVLCSARHAVEAHALCAVLEDAGIGARVVGESLADAAGSLPLGEPIAPRIWVHERVYDPDRPADNVVGPIQAPWAILGFAVWTGACLIAVGYLYR